MAWALLFTEKGKTKFLEEKKAGIDERRKASYKEFNDMIREDF